MLLHNIQNPTDGDEEKTSCDCCDDDCDCGDCKKCSGEKKDEDNIDPLKGDDNYINEYSDGNIEDDSRLYGRAIDNNLGEDENN